MTGVSYIDDKFSGIDCRTGGYYPPDNALAVGPGAIVTAENEAIYVADLTGKCTYEASLASFFAPLGSYSDTFDPRAIYDSASGRFIVTTGQHVNGTSSVLVAVSKDANPLDGWTYLQVPNTLAATWGDQPYVATDGISTFIATNNCDDSGAAVSNVTYVIPSSGGHGLYDGSNGEAISTQLGQGEVFQIAAVKGRGAFFIANDGNQLAIVSYSEATQHFSSPATLTLGSVDQGADVLAAAQKGTSQLLDAGDGRIASAVYANGCLYAVFEVMPPSGPDAGQPTVHWVKIDVSDIGHPVLVSQGDASGALIGERVATFNPSIAVDGNGDVLINFTASGPGIYPSAFYVVHHAGDAEGRFDLPVAYQVSPGPMNYGSGATPGRWGDYSSAVADPDDPAAFWISNEYAWGSSYYWGTTVSHIVVGSGTAAPQAVATVSPASGSSVMVADSAAAISASLDGLQTLAAAARLTTIHLTDGAAPVLSISGSQLARDGAALAKIDGAYSLLIDGEHAAAYFVAQQNAARRACGWTANLDAPGIAVAPGMNSVIGWENANLAPGNNTVVLDDGRYHYSVQVDGLGAVTIIDNDSGDRIAVSGARYLVFNGGSAAAPGLYDQIMLIESGPAAQIARLYQAIFGRLPDLPGLEAWIGGYANGLTMGQIETTFLGCQEFASRYGANDTDSQFVTALYQNVLSRTADASGLAAWVGALASGTLTRVQVLDGFVTSQEALARSSAWLADTSKGGFADPNLLLPAQTVVEQGCSSHYLSTALIDVNALGSGSAGAGGVIISGPMAKGGASLSANSSVTQTTVVLSPVFHAITVTGSGNTVYDSAAADSILLSEGLPGGGNTVILGKGGSDSIEFSWAAGNNNFDRIFNFVPGRGMSVNVTGAASPASVQLVDGTIAPVDGHSVDFGTCSAPKYTIVNVGNIDGGSAAEVAAAANKAYIVADFTGDASRGTLGENVAFIGKDNAGNTEVWLFKAAASYVFWNGHGVSAVINGADGNGNHLVDGNEISHEVTIIGVLPSQLSLPDLT